VQQLEPGAIGEHVNEQRATSNEQHGFDRPTAQLVRATLLNLLLSLMLVSHVLAQDGPNRAGLVVSFGDGQVVTRCVEFSEPTISGADLLQRSGLSIILDPQSMMGAAICKIEDVGCDFPGQDCFCQCQGAECIYWSYWHLQPDGSWEYSQLGASGWQVQPGSVDGWNWAPGEIGHAQPPPVYSFEQICPRPTPTPTGTATPIPPTPTFTPTPTWTPWPTVTPTPTPVPPTPTPTPVPLKVVFDAQPKTIQRGGCTLLRWDVEGAKAVYLSDGAMDQGVAGHDNRQVCPATTHTYVLRVLSPIGEERHTVTVDVQEPPPTASLPPTATPTRAATQPVEPQVATPTAVPTATPTPFPTPTATWTLAAPTAALASPVDTPIATPSPVIPSPTAVVPALVASPTPQPTTVGTVVALARRAAQAGQTAQAHPAAANRTGLPVQQLLRYGVFALIAAGLLGIGALTIWRQQG